MGNVKALPTLPNDEQPWQCEVCGEVMKYPQPIEFGKQLKLLKEFMDKHEHPEEGLGSRRDALYMLDFDQVSQYGHRTRHRPTLPSRVFDLATDTSLRRCAFVQQHERFHHNEWYLPLTDAHVRTWLKNVRFKQMPFVSVAGQDMVAGKEAPS